MLGRRPDGTPPSPTGRDVTEHPLPPRSRPVGVAAKIARRLEDQYLRRVQSWAYLSGRADEAERIAVLLHDGAGLGSAPPEAGSLYDAGFRDGQRRHAEWALRLVLNRPAVRGRRLACAARGPRD